MGNQNNLVVIMRNAVGFSHMFGDDVRKAWAIGVADTMYAAKEIDMIEFLDLLKGIREWVFE